jgi:hypothetical protein
MPGPAARLAKLHGHLLAKGMVPTTMEHLTLLVQLLTHAGSMSRCTTCLPAASAPGSAQQEPPAQQQELHVLCCPGMAARYACRALECAGRLAFSLGPQAMELLSECPALQQHGPQLAALLRKQLQQQQNSSKAPRAYELGTTGGQGLAGAAGLIGQPSPLEQVSRARTQEEQRRAANKEASRHVHLLPCMHAAPFVGCHVGMPLLAWNHGLMTACRAGRLCPSCAM